MSTRFNHHIIFALSFYLVLCSPKHSRLTNQTRELGLLKPHRDRLAVVLRRSSSNFKLTAELNLVNDCHQSCIVLLLFHSCYLLCVNGRSFLCWEINHISIYCCIGFFFLFLFSGAWLCTIFAKTTYLVLQYIAIAICYSICIMNFFLNFIHRDVTLLFMSCLSLVR
jgi:hypothetical protein